MGLDGLAPGGKLIVVGAPERPIVVNPFPLLLGRRTVAGWPSGTGMDSEDTLKFSALAGVKPMIEIYPLEKAGGSLRTHDERQGAIPRGAR